MARPRINDPAEVSDNPRCVTDPAREAELRDELKRRLQYIRSHYLSGRSVMSLQEHNASLASLKNIVVGKADAEGLASLSVLLQLRISSKAREFADERGTDGAASVSDDDRLRAMRWAAATLKPVRGRPAAGYLHHTIEGLMALVQEYSGRPVRVGKTRNCVDDPHFKQGASEIIPKLLRELDPSITETQLVNIVLRARRKYAGRPMRFESFFPGYSSGPLTIIYHTRDGGRVESGEPVRSI